MPTFKGYLAAPERSVAFSEYGGELQHCTKFDRSRLVGSQNGKMRGPAGPKLAALC
jgi:hypothetical protein